MLPFISLDRVVYAAIALHYGAACALAWDDQPNTYFLPGYVPINGLAGCFR